MSSKEKNYFTTEKTFCKRLEKKFTPLEILIHHCALTPYIPKLYKIEYISGEQWMVIEKGTPLDRAEIIDPITILDHVLQAIFALHQAGIAHMDVKMSNVVKIKDRYCLTDFNNSTPFCDQQLDYGLTTITHDAWCGKAFVSPATDIWAYAVFALEVFTGLQNPLSVNDDGLIPDTAYKQAKYILDQYPDKFADLFISDRKKWKSFFKQVFQDPKSFNTCEDTLALYEMLFNDTLDPSIPFFDKIDLQKIRLTKKEAEYAKQLPAWIIYYAHASQKEHPEYTFQEYIEMTKQMIPPYWASVEEENRTKYINMAFKSKLPNL